MLTGAASRSIFPRAKTCLEFLGGRSPSQAKPRDTGMWAPGISPQDVSAYTGVLIASLCPSSPQAHAMTRRFTAVTCVARASAYSVCSTGTSSATTR